MFCLFLFDMSLIKIRNGKYKDFFSIFYLLYLSFSAGYYFTSFAMLVCSCEKILFLCPKNYVIYVVTDFSYPLNWISFAISLKYFYMNEMILNNFFYTRLTFRYSICLGQGSKIVR